jgi:hypothetical protein
MAQCPRAWAIWLLPVSQGPTTKTPTFSVMNRQEASSVISARLIPGLKVKSNSSEVFWFLKLARRKAEASRF